MPYDHSMADYEPAGDWTSLTSADPVGDLRIFHAAIVLGRPLTTFEEIMVRNGAQFSSDGALWPRQANS